ncbi:uncharacterized protein LOC110814308 [Carica papaya]|uniref:uncharacterized protein LOC110814308 n=1 Tax=Carica papaya TaxID=3649 RepID=UPI000B8CDB57|nr:uncharacterized protein LOC110814308 [Carica papaya]
MMSRYPAFPCSGLVVVPKKAGKDVAQIFDMLVSDIKSYEHEREDLIVNPYLLGRGDPSEIRFTLGYIILKTMEGESTVGGAEEVDSLIRVFEENCHLTLSDMVKNQVVIKEERKNCLQLSVRESKQQMEKRQEVVQGKLGHFDEVITLRNQEMLVKGESGEMARKQQMIAETCQPPKGEVKTLVEEIKKETCYVLKQEKTLKNVEAVEYDSAKEENVNHRILQGKVTKKEIMVGGRCNLRPERLEKTNCYLSSEVGVKKNTEKQKQVSAKEKGGLRSLSSFFK